MTTPIFQRGFLSLIATQFLGAANDNLLKGVLTFMVIERGIWENQLGTGGQAIVGVCFTLPFILFSGYAGQLADRFSKRDLSMAIKVFEIPIALVAGLGFAIGNLWITLFALLALTVQSTFFGPAKYGMIPELVDERSLSRANGTINMMTNIAVIVGTLAAGLVSDLYNPPQLHPHPASEGMWLLPGTVMVLLAIAGLITVAFLTRLRPGNQHLQYDYHPFRTYIESIREMAKTPMLLVMMAWGYFFMLAGIALFILPEYTTVLNIDRTAASALMGILGISVGVGCALAGLISGHRIEPRLVPVGAAGLTFFFALLGLVPPRISAVAGDGAELQATMLQVATSNVSLFIFGAGIAAGFYIVPLQALLQKLSPDSERGRFLGTANAVSFTFMTLSAVIFYSVRGWFGDAPQQIFIVCAIMMAIGASFFLWRLRGSSLLTANPKGL